MVEWIALALSVISIAGTFVAWRRAEMRADRQDARVAIEWEQGRVRWDVEGPEVSAERNGRRLLAYRFVNRGREAPMHVWFDAASLTSVEVDVGMISLDVDPGDSILLSFYEGRVPLEKVVLKWFVRPSDAEASQTVRLPLPPRPKEISI